MRGATWSKGKGRLQQPSRASYIHCPSNWKNTRNKKSFRSQAAVIPAARELLVFTWCEGLFANDTALVMLGCSSLLSSCGWQRLLSERCGVPALLRNPPDLRMMEGMRSVRLLYLYVPVPGWRACGMDGALVSEAPEQQRGGTNLLLGLFSCWFLSPSWRKHVYAQA